MRTWRVNSSEREKRFSHLRGNQHRWGQRNCSLDANLVACAREHLGREYEGGGEGRAGGNQEDGFRCWAGVKKRSSCFSLNLARSASIPCAASCWSCREREIENVPGMGASMRLLARVSADMPSLVFEAVERPRAERTLVRPVQRRARARE